MIKLNFFGLFGPKAPKPIKRDLRYLKLFIFFYYDPLYTLYKIEVSLKCLYKPQFRASTYLDGFLAALRDINTGDTMLCKKWNNAVINKQKFLQSLTKRFSGESVVNPV